MRRPLRAAALAVAAVLGGCAAGVAARGCLGDVACGTLAGAGLRAGLLGIGVAAAVTLALIVLRATWLLASAQAAVGNLSHIVLPGPLLDAARRTGVRTPLHCVRDDDVLAFCVGTATPRVLVTDTLVARLRPDELDAILVHEGTHARRRDPLRHAFRHAAAEVLFYLPIAGWWARRHLVEAELVADRAAIARVGTGALAGALWVAGEGDGAEHSAGATLTGLRVRQIVGDAVPRWRPSAREVMSSLAGLGAAAAAVLCLGQLVGV